MILLVITIATTHHVLAEKNFLRGLSRIVGIKEEHEKYLSNEDLILSYDRNIQDANTRLLESDEGDDDDDEVESIGIDDDDEGNDDDDIDDDEGSVDIDDDDDYDDDNDDDVVLYELDDDC